MNRSAPRRHASRCRGAFGLLLAVAAALPSLAFAFNVYTVGADSACGYGSVQDAVDAAASNPGEDYVWIANNQVYDGQHVVIADQDVIVEGGFTDCSQTEPAGATTLHGSTARVFEISGDSHVELGYLGVLGGDVGDDDYGGGIYFGGAGSLTLVETSVLSSHAGYGGGIAVNPSGPSQLSLQHSYVALNDAAHDGGGLWLRNTTVYSDSDSQIFANDTADTDGGRGGGLFLGGPVSADLNSSIYNNSAGWGGGVYTYGGVDLNFYSTDAANRVALFGNAATHAGGAVYVYARTTTANLCAQDFSIESNTAHDGAAFQLDGPSTYGYLNDDAHTCVPASPPVAPVACAAGPHCNDISSNVSQQSDGTPTGGSTIVVGTFGNAGNLVANRFVAQHNQAGAFVYVNDGTAPASGSIATTLSNCVIADNVHAYYDVWAAGGADNTQLVIDHCTIANNTEQGGIMLYALAHDVQIRNSILDTADDSVTIYYYLIAGTNEVEYDLSSGNSIGGTGVSYGRASFVDAANGDYHLQRASLGVDYAPTQDGVDLDGNPRTVDLLDVANRYGPMDLGAYEIPFAGDACSAADTVFCDGFDGVAP